MSVPDSVIIDDSDPSIVYEEGKWVTDTSSFNYTVSGRPFNNTAHITFQQASFTITFQGTAIELWGLSSSSTAWTGTSGGQGIDLGSSSFGGSTAPGQQPSFRFSAGYDPISWQESTQNTLKMTVNGTKDNPVAFDFARFTPSGFSKPEDITVGVLEYTVSDAFQYGAVPKGWDNSDFLSTSTPDAPYIFNFTGTSVAGLGGNGVNDSHIQAIASYSIDGGAPINFTVNNLATSILDTITEQTIFQTDQYPPGNHSLQLVYHSNSTTTPLTLLSLLVTGKEASLSVDPAPPAQSSASTVPTSSSTSPPTVPANPTSTHAKSHKGTIAVALAVSLILIILLCIAGFFLYWRRRRRYESKRYSSYSVNPGPVAMAVVPFVDIPVPSSRYSNAAWASSGRFPKAKEGLTNLGESQTEVERLGPQQTPSSLPAEPTPPRVITRMHEDSGILPPQPTSEQVVVVDVPPSYTSIGGGLPRQNSRREAGLSQKIIGR